MDRVDSIRRPARAVDLAGRIPLAGALLRWWARRYREGSVVTIKYGEAAGFRWRRHHRYVNGYWIGQYELPIQLALKRELKPGDTFFDVGANAGFFSLVGAKLVGPAGKCVAFDPAPHNHQSLLEQFELNGLSYCHAQAEAVGEAEGEAMFCFHSPGSPSAHLGAARAGETQMKVKVTTLDAAAHRWGVPAVIKLDVEGAETQAVRGARELLVSAKPTWLIELHTPQSAAEVKQLLEESGYGFFDLEGRPIAEGESLPHHVIARVSFA